MSDPRHRLGHEAELMVARALTAAGWRVLAHRWRAGVGEIDLVCLDPGGALVAVEVRARRSARTGSAGESVGHGHLRRVRAALGEYAAASQLAHHGLRVDLVTLDRAQGRWRALRIPAVDAW